MINIGPVNIDLCGLPLWAFNLRAKFLDLFKDAIGLMTMGLIRKLLLPTTWSYFYIDSTSKKNICDIFVAEMLLTIRLTRLT